MHFWINKGNQGCGFNGRYVPPSISSGARRTHSRWVHPKPMVTPVHRFQSIESVISGVPRHPRASSYHTRFSAPFNQHGGGGSAIVDHSSGGSRQHQQTASHDYVANSQNHTITPNDRPASSGKLKCGIWLVISILPFLVVGVKYYFNKEDVGWEAIIFCVILILIMFIGAFVSLLEALNLKRHRRASVPISSEQNETFEDSSHHPHPHQHHHHHHHHHVPNLTPVHNSEMQPPPYHIAVMLPTQNEHLIQDSPPPTYEKAVT